MNKLVIGPQDSQRIWTDLLYLLGLFLQQTPQRSSKCFKNQDKKEASFSVTQNRNRNSYSRGIARYIHSLSCSLCPHRQILRTPGLALLILISKWQQVCLVPFGPSGIWVLPLSACSAPQVHLLSRTSDRHQARACCTWRFHHSLFVNSE